MNDRLVIHRSSREKRRAKRHERYAARVLIALRVTLGILILAAAAVAVVPLLVLVDLTTGGSGWGLCPAGLEACTNSYFTGPELFVLLIVALFALLGGIAICMKRLRILQTSSNGPS